MKKAKYSSILNSISNLLIISCLCVFLIMGVNRYYKKYYSPLNYLELSLTYKNCIIVGKSDHNGYMLLLHNPYLHKEDSTGVMNVDCKVYVADYIYFNNFIGDTIK